MAAIKDVAKLAGLSPAAVSKYLKRPDSVRPDTRQRIEAAIAELNYVPNAAARSLRTGRTDLYLLMLSHMNNPYFVEQFIALNEEATRRGYRLLVQTAQFEDMRTLRESSSFYVPAVQQVDGVIFMIAKNEHILDTMRTVGANIPVVAYSWPYSCPGVDTIVVDMEDGIYQMTSHLLQQGHTRIGYLSDHETTFHKTADKINGYYRALSEYGIAPDPSLCYVVPPLVTGGCSGMEQLMQLPDRPTAVVCENDVLAVGCLQYARANRITVPEQVAVAGQDDCYMTHITSPNLTSSTVSNHQMAIQAFDMLEQRRANSSLPPQCTVYRCRLTLRESTEGKQFQN